MGPSDSIPFARARYSMGVHCEGCLCLLLLSIFVRVVVWWQTPRSGSCFPGTLVLAKFAFQVYCLWNWLDGAVVWSEAGFYVWNLEPFGRDVCVGQWQLPLLLGFISFGGNHDVSWAQPPFVFYLWLLIWTYSSISRLTTAYDRLGSTCWELQCKFSQLLLLIAWGYLARNTRYSKVGSCLFGVCGL